MPNLEVHQLGKYRLLRPLGEGGYADVYLGEHVHLGKLVAVKVLRMRLRDTDVQAFHTEAKIIARLEHPHIVKISDYGVEHDYPYFVMEYATNGTLRGLHPQGTILPLEKVVLYVTQVGEALQYAHDNRIVHRDVKPENMLVGQDGRILLSDFGIAVTAHATETLTSQSEAGTVRYMAPECFEKKAQPASDQYSLAVVVYEWLCGVPPFSGETVIQLAVQHIGTTPPPLYGRMPGIAPSLDQVVQKALAKDPRQRFASVQAFAKALEECLHSISTQTQPMESRAENGFLQQPQILPTQRVMADSGGQSSSSLVNGRARRRFPVSRRDFIAAGIGAAVVLASEGLIYWRTHLSPPPPIYTYRGHTDPVQVVKWSPDGTNIASGGNDARILVWNASVHNNSRSSWGTGVATYVGHTGIIRDLAWSHNGKWIASASNDMTVQIWDALSGKNLHTYKKHTAPVYGVAWSLDDSLILSGGFDKSVRIWNPLNDTLLTSYSADANVDKVAWSPDGKRVAVATADRVDVLNFVNNTLQNPLTYNRHNGLTVEQVVWAPDGQSLASVSSDQTMQVWDARTATQTFKSPEFQNSVWGIGWSPDGSYLAAASKDKTLQVWKLANGTWNQVVTNVASDFLTSVVWSPDSRYCAAGVFDGTVQIWDITQE